MKLYERVSFEVHAEQYEPGKGMEDGFETWTDIITHGWFTTDLLVKIEREDGTIVCPYITTKRGRSFIGEGDFIITEGDGERHVCGKHKFYGRFREI